MINLIKRYRYFLVMVLINLILLWLKLEAGLRSFKISADNMLQVFLIIPPIFILLGLLDIWVKRETMIKWMGESSGLLGITIAFLLGSFAAGPLYAAFPVAGVLLNKGSRFSNIIIFIGAWSTTKIPMLLFETSTMGWRFMLIRFILDIFGITAIAYLTEKIMTTQEKEIIYEKANMLG
jgi:uncharacterized membrane protein YraQ (UPF0718 family)